MKSQSHTTIIVFKPPIV